MGDPVEGVPGDIVNSMTAGAGMNEGDGRWLRRREVGLPVPLIPLVVVVVAALDSQFFLCRDVGVVPPSDR